MCAVVKAFTHKKCLATTKSEESSVVYGYSIVIENLKLSVVTIEDDFNKNNE